nr:probable zinc metalloprotease EGY1, chloroplastic [Setaria viridis]
MAGALASSPLVHLTTSRLRLPRPRASVPSPAPGCSRGVCSGWRLTVGWRAARRCDRLRCFSNDGGGGEEGEKRTEEEASAAAAPAEELGSERSRSGSFSSSSSSSGTPGVSSEPSLLSFSVDNIDTVKLLELLGPEKVDLADVKAIKENLFGYTTFWLTKEEPFGDLGEGVLFIGNLRGKREEIFAKLQRQLRELTGDKYNLFMVEEPNSEGDDPRGGPRVSFGLLRKEVSEPGPTTLWQYVISLLLFLLTMFSCVELGIASKISSLPPEIVSYFTDPNATGPPPDMQLLLPFVESALPVAYGVLAIQIFHEIGHFLAAFPKNVKLSIPFFIPNFTLGTFGAITQFKSILPDKKTMFDISMAGPVAGAALSFSMFFVGLLLSSNPVGASDLVEVPSQLFQGSLLLGLISRATLGYRCGLTTSAFNMLPVGCLDGGRALQGAFGKEALFGFGLTTYSLLGLGVLGGPLSLPWGLYVLICQRTPEKPCLNDVSDVGTWRRAALIASVFLVVLTLIPLWDELAEDLGGYSLAKGMGVGRHIASETFTVGGYQWAIYFYPDGKNPEDNSAYVSVFIALASEGTDVRALFELTLLDQSGKGKHKVHSHFDRSLESGPYTLKYRGSMWGYKRFFRRTALETSDFLKDDCLKINCTVGVVVSTMDYSRPHSIEVPESDIGYHFGTLLDNQEGVDVIFSVAGEKFHAHKLVLAARSSFFRSEFFDHESDEEKNEADTRNEIKEIVIDDMDPKVFKAVLHFIYRDNLVNDDELSASSSHGSVFDTLAGKLMAAADKYELPRLRLLCESYLCKHISVNSVSTTLALADRHHAMELKSVCLKFAAENLSAVIRSEGYDYLKDNCPALQSEILRTLAGCEEQCSSGGKSQSVWAQLSDGGDTSGRRVRPRV